MSTFATPPDAVSTHPLVDAFTKALADYQAHSCSPTDQRNAYARTLRESRAALERQLMRPSDEAALRRAYQDGHNDGFAQCAGVRR